MAGERLSPSREAREYAIRVRMTPGASEGFSTLAAPVTSQGGVRWIQDVDPATGGDPLWGGGGPRVGDLWADTA